MKKLRYILSLVLTLALALGLAACFRKVTPPDTPSNTPNPNSSVDYNAILNSAYDMTESDLRDRFSASRISGLAAAADFGSLTADFTVGWPDEYGDPAGTVTGTLVYDSDSGCARVDASSAELELEGSLYYSPEFFGLACPTVFGGGTFYGLRPSGLAEQLDGTPFAQLLEIDMTALHDLDELLASIPPDVHVYREGEADAALRLTRELIEGLELSRKNASITRGGETYKGYDFTGTLSAQDIAEYFEELSKLSPALDLTGQAKAVRENGSDMTLTFSVADGKLWHVSGEYRYEGSTVYFEAEFYGDDGDMLRLTVDPYFSLELSMSGDIHLTANSGDSHTNIDWKVDGSFDFNTYRFDITDLALVGTLTAEDGVISFDGIWYTGERGDRNELNISVYEGGSVAAPEKIQSVAEMTENDLYKMIMGIVFRLAA